MGACWRESAARDPYHAPVTLQNRHLREIVAPIGDDLPGLRDRALLLGFAGAFRRAELARIEVAHLEAADTGCASPCPSPRVTGRARGC